MKFYEYHHVVGFEETNLLGNVYFVNHLKWQGHCREMFLRDHAPGILDELKSGLRLATVRCSCEYEDELLPFDHVVVRMSLRALKPNGMSLQFAYFRVQENGEVPVAHGEQEIACLRGTGRQVFAAPVPEELREALRPYGEVEA